MMEEKAESIPAYPECILPQSTYQALIDGEELWSKANGLRIQRRCADNVDVGVLTPEIFGNNIAEMSVNLLGGKFLPEHVRFTPKKVTPLSAGIPFDTEGNYRYAPEARGVYMEIACIHGGSFPSMRKFPNSQEYEKVKRAIKEEYTDAPKMTGTDDAAMTAHERLIAAFRRKKGFSKEEDYEVEYRISVMHRPTNANYWHCQIEIAPACEDGKTVRKEQSEWQKNALRALTNFLVGYASLDCLDPVPLVKEEWYIKLPA